MPSVSTAKNDCATLEESSEKRYVSTLLHTAFSAACAASSQQKLGRARVEISFAACATLSVVSK